MRYSWLAIHYVFNRYIFWSSQSISDKMLVGPFADKFNWEFATELFINFGYLCQLEFDYTVLYLDKY